MDPRLAIAMAALATSNTTLGAEAARSQNVMTRQIAGAALANSGPAPPIWLPQAPSGDYASAFDGFKDGNYYANGAVATAAINTENLDWVAFDPATIVAGSGLGSLANDANPVLDRAVSGPLLTSGYTCLVIISASGNNFNIDIESTQLPDYTDEFVAGFGNTGGQCTIYPDGSAFGVTAAMAGVGVHKVAFTITDTKISWSVDGEAFHTISGGPATTFTDIVMAAASTTSISYWQSVAWWAPQPDADLATLSTL